MKIDQEKQEGKLTLRLSGRLDTATAPQVDAVVKEQIKDIQTLVFDLQQLEYISSAGLRVLLAAQKTMNKQGKMIVQHPNDSVREIFDMTGFTDILTIEQ